MTTTTTQPRWKFVANLGDASPLDYGGLFVYVDETGVYPAEAEYVERDSDENDSAFTVYRFPLDRCTFTDGVLSDNQFHPDHAAWFAKPADPARPQDTTYLHRIASMVGTAEAGLAALFCSADPLDRARAYEWVGTYHGFDNLDSYPLRMRRRELRNRYLEKNGQDYGKRD